VYSQVLSLALDALDNGLWLCGPEMAACFDAIVRPCHGQMANKDAGMSYRLDKVLRSRRDIIGSPMKPWLGFLSDVRMWGQNTRPRSSKQGIRPWLKLGSLGILLVLQLKKGPRVSQHDTGNQTSFMSRVC
jgi:hypothetical protein